MMKQSFTKQEMKDIIEGKGAKNRIPMMYNFWTSPVVFGKDEKEAARLLKEYPNDAGMLFMSMPNVFDAPEDEPSFRWVNYDNPYEGTTKALDDIEAIDDWDKLDDILSDFPNPNSNHIFPDYKVNPDQYNLGGWWYCLFERHWSLRGMANALMDYYTDPESVHRLYRALTDFYMRIMEIAKEKYDVDAFFTSDDIGTQTSPFFSPEIFREFFKPYYKELIDKAHSLGAHFWLHSCGNIEILLPDFIEIGLDVIHPIQKYTMDQKEIADKYGNAICIWAGFDVQQIIPWGTSDEVRQEVRSMIDTYYNPNGRLILTAGNGITNDCKLSSLEALLDETYHYGLRKCSPDII